MVPRLRNGEFSTDLFQRYQRSEQALVLAMMEMVIQGVSTRKVSAITEELCGTSFSKSTISALCAALDPAVEAFRNRALGKRYPFVMVDATFTKVRNGDQVRSKGLMVALGVNEEGTREVLGFQCADTESEAGWTGFFNALKERGLSEVDLVISDSHKGLVQAVRRCFQGAAWQRCQTHFSKNVLDVSPRKLKPELHDALRSLYEADDYQTALMLRNRITERFQESAPKAVKVLEEGFDDVMSVLSLPPSLRRRLRTTNGLERVNEELRRRERVIRIFPNEQSLYRLLGALLMEIHEEWQTGRAYLNLNEYLVQKTEPRDTTAELSAAS
jgi:transposase-like protein